MKLTLIRDYKLEAVFRLKEIRHYHRLTNLRTADAVYKYTRKLQQTFVETISANHNVVMTKMVCSSIFSEDTADSSEYEMVIICIWLAYST